MIDGNKLTGSIPTEVGSLTTLGYIALGKPLFLSLLRTKTIISVTEFYCMLQYAFRNLTYCCLSHSSSVSTHRSYRNLAILEFNSI